MAIRKTRLLFFLFIATAGSMHGQPVQFSEKFWDPANYIGGNAVVETPDKGYLVAGYFSDFALLVKLNSSGTNIWNQTYDFGLSDRFNDIVFTHDSCYVLLGTTDTGLDSSDVLALKIDSTGNIVWSKTIDFAPHERGIAIKEMFDHGFVLTGDILNSAPPNSEILAAKMDSAGNLEWATSILATAEHNHGQSVDQLPDSGYILAAELDTTFPFRRSVALIKLSEQGVLAWANAYVNPTNDLNKADVLVTPTGITVLMAGTYDLALVRTDFSGQLFWSRSFEGTGIGYEFGGLPPQIHATPDGGYVFTNGTDMGNFHGLYCDTWKTDSSGNVHWKKVSVQASIEAIPTSDSGYLVLGGGPFIAIAPEMTGEFQFGLIKTDSAGQGIVCIDPSIEFPSFIPLNYQSLLPTQTFGGNASNIFPVISTVALTVDPGCVDFYDGAEEHFSEKRVEVFPNPAAGDFEVQYISNPGERTSPNSNTLEIIDVFGNVVFTSEIKSTCIVSGERLSRGIYFVRLRNANGRFNEKIIIE